MLGLRVNNFEIVRLLGAGGMGTVYEAQHLFFGKKVAVKVLRPELVATGEVVQRFFNEARATSAICHPNIVEVMDAGVLPDGVPYLVMELLEGESLADRLNRERFLPIAMAVELAQQAASALEAAHEKGIVHRDLKPDNLFLLPDRRGEGRELVKVLDFGIAKLRADPSAPVVNTVAGALFGTPPYMSPEQCRGLSAQVDQRTDIYALGVIVYEMLCGYRPFVAESVVDLMMMHMSAEPVPPSQRCPGLSAELERVVLKALAKDPDDRFSTMAEFSAALGPVAATLQAWPGPRTPQQGSRPWDGEEPERAGRAAPSDLSDKPKHPRSAAPNALTARATQVNAAHLPSHRDDSSQIQMRSARATEALPSPPPVRPRPAAPSSSRQRAPRASGLELAPKLRGLARSDARGPAIGAVCALGLAAAAVLWPALLARRSPESAIRSPERPALEGPVAQPSAEAAAAGQPLAHEPAALGTAATVLANAESAPPGVPPPPGPDEPAAPGGPMPARPPQAHGAPAATGSDQSRARELGAAAARGNPDEAKRVRSPSGPGVATTPVEPRAAQRPPARESAASGEPAAAEAPAEAPEPGFLSLDSAPWSDVFLAGKLLGTTPLVRVPLPPGRHVLTLKNPELGASTSYVVEIRAGKTLAKLVGWE